MLLTLLLLLLLILIALHSLPVQLLLRLLQVLLIALLSLPVQLPLLPPRHPRRCLAMFASTLSQALALIHATEAAAESTKATHAAEDAAVADSALFVGGQTDDGDDEGVRQAYSWQLARTVAWDSSTLRQSMLTWASARPAAPALSPVGGTGKPPLP